MSAARTDRHSPRGNKNQRTAMYLAMAVRNAMEDFHSQYLSNAQMAELNPIIRNAMYTALYAQDRPFDPLARAFVMFTTQEIPDYWELPELIDVFASKGASKRLARLTSKKRKR